MLQVPDKVNRHHRCLPTLNNGLQTFTTNDPLTNKLLNTQGEKTPNKESNGSTRGIRLMRLRVPPSKTPHVNLKNHEGKLPELAQRT